MSKPAMIISEEPEEGEESGVVAIHPRADRSQHLRIVEALLCRRRSSVDGSIDEAFAGRRRY